MNNPMPASDSTHWETITNLDKLIHEPARLAIMMLLHVVHKADFLYIQHQTGLTKGNLSAHLSKLEAAGYVDIEKSFEGKMPHTLCRLTDVGRQAFQGYLGQMREVFNDLPE